jgi:hypothetical protein
MRDMLRPVCTSVTGPLLERKWNGIFGAHNKIHIINEEYHRCSATHCRSLKLASGKTRFCSSALLAFSWQNSCSSSTRFAVRRSSLVGRHADQLQRLSDASIKRLPSWKFSPRTVLSCADQEEALMRTRDLRNWITACG